VNITGGRDLTLHEVNEAAQIVTQAAGEDANVIFGAVIDPSLDGDLLITVVATGFGSHGNLRLIERAHRSAPAPAAVAAAAGDDDLSGMRAPAWQRREGRPGWGRSGSRADSLEVPTFLRRQMD